MNPLVDLPPGLAGAATIGLIVVLGIFVYPSWLRSRRGRAAVALCTVLLLPLFALFERASDGSAAVSALVWGSIYAIAPVAVGAIVWRLQRS